MVAGSDIKSNIALCMKNEFYYYKDEALEMLEWILMVRELNVGRIFMYTYKFHPNMLKVLQ